MTHLFTLFLRLAQAENKCKQMGRWQSLLSTTSETNNKLEECRLQGVRKFAVNANVSG